MSGVVKQTINLINSDMDQLDKSHLKQIRFLKITKIIVNFLNVFSKNKEKLSHGKNEVNQ